MDSSGQPVWARLLVVLYTEGESTFPDSDAASERLAESIATRFDTEMTGEDVAESIEYLVRNDLLRSEDGRYTLTERGFDVAHEWVIEQRKASRNRQKAERQLDVSRAGVYVSIGLLIVGLFRFLAFVYNQIGISDLGLVISLILAVALVVRIIYEISRDDLLTAGEVNQPDDEANLRFESQGDPKDPAEDGEGHEKTEYQRKELKER